MYHKTHPFCQPQQPCGNGEHAQYDFVQVDHRLNEKPFSTHCVYCVFYKLILCKLCILQIVILGCTCSVYCVFYKLTLAHIAYIAYIVLHLLGNIALRCVAYFTSSPL